MAVAYRRGSAENAAIVAANAGDVPVDLLVPGPADEAGNKGFRRLAGYIFGDNKGERKIEMTAPVTQTPVPAKIEMTAPVAMTEADGGYLVQFTMPASFTLDTLPEPLDPQVRLRQVPAARYAVIRYSGFWSDSNYNDHLDQLRRAVAAAGLRTYLRLAPPPKLEAKLDMSGVTTLHLLEAVRRALALHLRAIVAERLAV